MHNRQLELLHFHDIEHIKHLQPFSSSTYLTYSHLSGVSLQCYLHSVLHLHRLRFPERNEQVQKKSTEPSQMSCTNVTVNQKAATGMFACRDDARVNKPVHCRRNDLRPRYSYHSDPLAISDFFARGATHTIAGIRSVFTGTTRDEDVLGKLWRIDNWQFSFGKTEF
ncbi:hypothetical protein EDC04DRAFT_2704222, partial [Pisolithus marmoratus]